jgi:enoyl-CoA hydratase/carnithine racemase
VTEPAVLFKPGAPVAEIVLNRPWALNAMDMAWVDDFSRAAAEAAATPEAVIVVVRGEGRAFCAGLDLKMAREGGMPEGFYPKQEEGFTTLEAMDKLVIAQIQGHCLGGGVQLAIACDIRIAREDATFGIPAPTEGLFPGMAVWRLPRFIGLGRALHFAISGDRIDAIEAQRIGLVDYVCPVEGFEEAASEVVSRYTRISHAATRATKRLMRRSFERDFDAVFAESLPLLEASRSSTEVIGAAEAFQQRLAQKKGDKESAD